MIRPFKSDLKIKTNSLAILAVALAPIAYFLPAIYRGDILCPDDGILFNVPLRVAAARMVDAGHLPLWNPYIFSGMPLLAAAQGGLLFPLNWFYLVFSPPTATNLMVVSSYIVAGIGAYLYARTTGAAIGGALLTGLVWPAGGCLIGQISHINIVHTAALMPWVFWSVESYALRGKYGRGLLISLFVAIQVFAGHQQTFAYSATLVIAYLIVLAIAHKQLRQRYSAALAFVGAGIVLSAVQIVPTFELLRNSSRASATYEFFTSFSMPRRFVLTLLAPYVMGGGDGRLFRAPYVGPPYYPELVGYVGLVALMLALTAVLCKSDVRTRFWGLTAAICFVLAMGAYAPLQFYRVIYYVPVLNLFRVPARHLMEVDFALAVLAGRGFTVLAAAPQAQRRLIRTFAVGATVFLLTVLAVTWLRPAEFHLGREATVGVIRAPELFIPIGLAALSAFALWCLASQKRGSAALVFAVLAVDLLMWGQSSGWYLNSPLRRDEVWQTPDAVRAVREVAPADTSSFRILTAAHTFDPAVPPVGPSVSRATDFVLATQPDVYMMSGLQNAAGYDGFGLERYSRLAGQMKVWGELTDPDASLRGPGHELDLVNVRYLLSRRNQSGKVEAASLANFFQPANEQHGNFMFASTDLGLPGLTAGKRLTFAINPVEIDRVALMTNLSFSEMVPDKTVVARLRLTTIDGQKIEFPLRAGVDTAEWAYDRPDIRARIQHSRPTVATSYEVNDANGKYEAHTFVSSLTLPQQLNVIGGEIVIETTARWPDLGMTLFRLSLVNASEGKSYALRRNLFTVEPIAAPVTSAPNTGATDRWRLLTHTKSVDVYENTRALPRVWVASEARVIDTSVMLEVIRSGKFPDGTTWDPRQTALIESPIAEKLQPGATSQAEITRYEPNRIQINARADAPALLVLSENHYPGWRAFVDGRGVDTLRVDYNLRGVILPAGEHKIEFSYWPKSVLIGFVISIVTLIAMGLGLGFRRS